MAKDDYFKLVYAILTELYESKKSGTKVPPDAIHPERFGIPVSYWLDSVKITMSGIAYLQDNSKMKQMYELAKEVRDWIPGM